MLILYVLNKEMAWAASQRDERDERDENRIIKLRVSLISTRRLFFGSRPAY